MKRERYASDKEYMEVLSALADAKNQNLGREIVPMDDGALHLLDPDGERALKLLAFVRVMPSPKTEANACYFYNRRQASNQKFVSYHFEADSEIEEFHADTLAALEGLLPFGS